MTNLDMWKQETPPERPDSDYTQCDICEEVTPKEDTEFMYILIPKTELEDKKLATKRVCYKCKKELAL